MSMGPMGALGAAGSHLAQTQGTEKDRAAQETTDQSRASSGQQNAEKAEGIGAADREEQASDRDADGRRLWEETPTKDGEEAEDRQESEGKRPGRDASGQRGNLLDLSG